MLNRLAKILWLASYPKSGNTWVRSFLTSLTNKNEFDINKIDYGSYISTRVFADRMLGYSLADLPDSDYVLLKSTMYKKWAAQTNKNVLPCKIHDACLRGTHVICPPEISLGTVYIMRNPFDIVASLANHRRIDNAAAAVLLCNDKYTMAGKKNGLPSQAPQYLGTWSNHVKSWTDVHADNMLLIKYEDLTADPFSEFSKIVNYMELNYSNADIRAAINKTTINNLQKLELQAKFHEAPKVKIFFRSGKVGNWRNEITHDEAKQIVDCNFDVLLKYNYINDNGDILV